MDADIAILGGGVLGCSVAYHLARRGCDVVVVERSQTLGEGGSTSKATGGFRAQFDNETEVRLSLLSRAKLFEFEDELGIDSGFRPYGYLFLARTDDELALLRLAQQAQRACGVEEAFEITARDARILNPAVADPAVIGGMYSPADGFIRPMNILRGYAEGARRLGVRFELGATFEGFRAEDDRVIAARTTRGDVHARLFVNAMGAWAGAPVVPLRRNVAATVPTTILPETMPMTIWAGDWYHLRVRDGRVLLLWPDDPPVDDWLRQVLRRTRERVPLLDGLAIEECWSGLYEMSPDERALVGRSPDRQNLYLATGCSGHGVMHAPAIGQLVAELLVDGSTSIDISDLDPSRFSRSAGSSR